MVRRRKKLRLVIDMMAVVRGARALRQKPPVPKTPELILIFSWMEYERAFDWLFSETILNEYSEVLRRLKVPRNAVGRFINLLREGDFSLKLKIGASIRLIRRTIPSTTARLMETRTISLPIMLATFRP